MPKKPTPPRLLFIALAGPFYVLGNLEKPEIRIEQRAEGMGFEGYWGALLGVLDRRRSA